MARIKATTSKAGVTKNRSRKYGCGGKMSKGTSYKCGGKLKTK